MLGLCIPDGKASLDGTEAQIVVALFEVPQASTLTAHVRESKPKSEVMSYKINWKLIGVKGFGFDVFEYDRLPATNTNLEKLTVVDPIDLPAGDVRN